MTRRPPPAPGVIIERPDLQTAAQRFGFWTLTFLGWALYGYLWMPLITLTAWQFDLSLTYRRMFIEGGYVGLLQVLSGYLVVYALLAGVYMGWARYNLWRFRGHERRSARPACSLEDEARAFGVPQGVVAAWRKARRVVVHLDEAAQVTQSAAVLVRMQRLQAMVQNKAEEPMRPKQRSSSG